MLNSKNSAPILLGALMFVILLAIYYYIILPKHEVVNSVQGSISVLNQEITNLQTSIEMQQNSDENPQGNIFAMRKKLPMDKDLVKLLLNIEEIELVSDSKIVSIEFNNYDALVNQSNLQQPNEPAEIELQNGIAEQNQELPVSPVSEQSLPPELKMVGFNLNIEALNEQNLLTFVKELEDADRIIRIDQINYVSPGEEVTYDKAASTLIEAQIQGTAFYYIGQ